MRAERLDELEALLAGYDGTPHGSTLQAVYDRAEKRDRLHAALRSAAPELLALARAALEWQEADAAWHAAPVETLELLDRLEAAEARLRGAGS